MDNLDFDDRRRFFSYLAQTSDAPLALEIVKAEGLFLYAADGKKYLDLISGISVSSLGHRHPEVMAAINGQLEKYLHTMVYGEYILSPQVQLAELLVKNLATSLHNVYLTNSGSEAVEGAIKLARRATGRAEVISFKNAYHGHTHGAMSAMGVEDLKRPFRPLLPGFNFLEFNDIADLRRISRETACVLIEPVQGEAGVINADESFLRALRLKCSETGTLLIFDEAQTGFGRTGHLFAHQGYGIVPDILVLAKALGAGMPLGAFIAAGELMNCLTHDPPLGHITTFGGHPMSAAAALAGLKVLLKENYIAEVRVKEELFRGLLEHHPLVKEFRSAGLMMAMDLADADLAKKIITGCLGKGIVLDWFLFNAGSIRLAPPLTIAGDEIENACRVINGVMDDVLSVT